MEDADYPSGWPHRHKRSRAQMEGYDRSRSPSWYTNPLSQAGEVHPTVPFYRAFEQQREAAASGARASIYDRNEASNSQPYSAHHSRPSASSARSNMSGLHLPEPGNMASESQRFPGDGFDYRRPAGLTREATVTPVDLEEEDDLHIDLSRDEDVIDLTADDSGYGASQDDGRGERQDSNSEGSSAQPHRDRRTRNAPPRLPRGMDIIIDLDNGHEEWRLGSPSATAPVPEPGSPELEFISSRRIQTPRAQSPGNNNDGDEVQFLREQPLSQAEMLRRRNQEHDAIIDLLGNMNGRFPHLRAQVDRFNAQVRRVAAGHYRPQQAPRAPIRSRGGHGHYIFEAPLLDFEMVGFDLGMEPTRQAEPPAPTYKAPEKAAEGFTRSPQEDDVLVCPNCDCELCEGEDDIKRQVWIVKACGHVYCGECATNRSASKKSQKGKGAARTKPFQKCVVEGCEKKVINSKTMVQVFL